MHSHEPGVPCNKIELITTYKRWNKKELSRSSPDSLAVTYVCQDRQPVRIAVSLSGPSVSIAIRQRTSQNTLPFNVPLPRKLKPPHKNRRR